MRSEDAVAATAEKYGNYCYSIAFSILHNAEDAEECVNDAYLAAWNSIPPHRPERVAAFLGKITRNVSLNRWKQYNAQKRGEGQTELALSELEECIPAKTGIEQAVEDELLTWSIEKFLYSQPRLKRNLFIRRYWYISSIQELADEYGMSESKVKSLLFRMRKKTKNTILQRRISYYEKRKNCFMLSAPLTTA